MFCCHPDRKLLFLVPVQFWFGTGCGQPSVSWGTHFLINSFIYLPNVKLLE